MFRVFQGYGAVPCSKGRLDQRLSFFVYAEDVFNLLLSHDCFSYKVQKVVKCIIKLS